MNEDARRRAVANQALYRLGESFPEVGPVLRNPRKRADFMKMMRALGVAMQPEHTCPPPEKVEVRVPVQVPVRVDLTLGEMAQVLRRAGWTVKVPASEEGGTEQRRISAGSQAHRMLLVFRDHPEGLTDEEARELARVSVRSTYWKRTSELREAGYLVWVVDPSSGNYLMRQSASSGVSVHVSTITEDGIQMLKELDDEVR